MKIRLFFILGLLGMFVASGFYLEATAGFYFRYKESWFWLFDYIKEYKSLPDFIIKQLYIIGGITPFYFIAVILLSNRLKTKTIFGTFNQKNLHGSAHWATWQDVKKAGLTGKNGVVVGGYKKGKNLRKLCHNGDEHILCFAPTGSGKGVGLVLPTLLTWQHSVLVFDIKGENYSLTSGYRASIGQRVLKFDPSAEFGSISFNPLEEIRIGTSYEIQDAQNIATILLDEDGKGINADHWRQNAFGWLTAGILYTLYKVRAEANRTASLYDVSVMMSANGLENLIEDMQSFLPMFEDEIRKDVQTTILSSANNLEAKHDGERSGVHSTAVTPLILYQDPIVAKNTSKSNFRIMDLLSKDNPISLYIILPPSQINRLKSLFRIIMDIILKKLTDKLPNENSNRVLLMLDEFTSIGKLEIFETSIAYLRGYGIKSYIIIQDLKQLQKAYGKEESIMSNCHIKIAYATNQPETAKVLSDMSGKTTVIQKKTSTSSGATALVGNVSNSMTETSRSLLNVDECMSLQGAIKDPKNDKKVITGGDMLIFPAGFAPIRGKQYLYFQDRELLRRSTKTIPLPPEEEPETQILPIATQLEPQEVQEEPTSEFTKAIMKI